MCCTGCTGSTECVCVHPVHVLTPNAHRCLRDQHRYNEGSCPLVRCALRYDSATPTCAEKTCYDHYDAVSCIAAGCTFDNTTYICYTDSGAACDTYNPHPISMHTSPSSSSSSF